MQRIFDMLPGPLSPHASHIKSAPYKTPSGAAAKSSPAANEGFFDRVWGYMSGRPTEIGHVGTPEHDTQFNYRRLSPEEEEYIIRVHHNYVLQQEKLKSQDGDPHLIKSNIEKAAAAAEDVLHRLHDSVSDAYDSVKHRGEKVAKQAGGQLYHAYEASKERLEEAVDAVRDHVREKAPTGEQVDQAIKSGKEEWHKGAEYASNKLSDARDQAQGLYQGAKEQVMQAARTAVEQAQHAAQSGSEQASDTGRRVYDAIPGREAFWDLGRRLTGDFGHSGAHRMDSLRGSGISGLLPGHWGAEPAPGVPVTGFYLAIMALYFCLLLWRVHLRQHLSGRRHSEPKQASPTPNEKQSIASQVGQAGVSIEGFVDRPAALHRAAQFLQTYAMSAPFVVMLLGYLEATGVSHRVLHALYTVFVLGHVITIEAGPKASLQNAAGAVSGIKQGKLPHIHIKATYAFMSATGVLLCASFATLWTVIGQLAATGAKRSH